MDFRPVTYDVLGYTVSKIKSLINLKAPAIHGHLIDDIIFEDGKSFQQVMYDNTPILVTEAEAEDGVLNEIKAWSPERVALAVRNIPMTGVSSLSSLSGDVTDTDSTLQAIAKLQNRSKSQISDHNMNFNNPHNVTLAQIGAAAANHTHPVVPPIAHKHNASDINSGTLNMQRIESSGTSNRVLRVGTANSTPFWSVLRLDTDVAGTLSIANGGTGGISAADARSKLGITLTNLGAAASNHGHDISDSNINGVLSVNKGGTGANNTADARNNLGINLTSIGAAAKDHGIHVPTLPNPYDALLFLRSDNRWSGISTELIGAAKLNHDHLLTDSNIKSILPVAKGGTNADNPSDARSNLGITPVNIGAATNDHGHSLTDSKISGILPISKGGTNAITASDARNKLEITPANIGAALASHGNHVPTTEVPNNLRFLRNDNSWYSLKLDDLDGAHKDHTHPLTDSKITGILPISKGGTGAGDAATARSNLGITPANIGAADTDIVTTTANGLSSKEDKTKLDGIATGATKNTASSTTPKAPGTASAGSEANYARGDHVHPKELPTFRLVGTTLVISSNPAAVYGYGMGGYGENPYGL